MAFTEAQQTTMVQATNRGVLFHAGDPCECAEDADVGTRMEHGYSDTVVYYHACRVCGAEWETWTEG